MAAGRTRSSGCTPVGWVSGVAARMPPTDEIEEAEPDFFTGAGRSRSVWTGQVMRGPARGQSLGLARLRGRRPICRPSGSADLSAIRTQV